MDNGVCYWRCAKRTCPAGITTEGNDLKQQTAPHNHAVDVVDTQVKTIQSHMKKRAREEISLSQFNPLFVFIIASVIKG